MISCFDHFFYDFFAFWNFPKDLKASARFRAIEPRGVHFWNFPEGFKGVCAFSTHRGQPATTSPSRYGNPGPRMCLATHFDKMQRIARPAGIHFLSLPPKSMLKSTIARLASAEFYTSKRKYVLNIFFSSFSTFQHDPKIRPHMSGRINSAHEFCEKVSTIRSHLILFDSKYVKFMNFCPQSNTLW